MSSAGVRRLLADLVQRRRDLPVGGERRRRVGEDARDARERRLQQLHLLEHGVAVARPAVPADVEPDQPQARVVEQRAELLRRAPVVAERLDLAVADVGEQLQQPGHARSAARRGRPHLGPPTAQGFAATRRVPVVDDARGGCARG
jgi:hypothetical protein